jgi:hypothetical protein
MHLQRLYTHYLRLSPRRCKGVFIPFWKIQLRLCFRRGVSYLSLTTTLPRHLTSPLRSADPTEKTFTLFGKIKGRAEAALLSLPSTPAYSALRVYNVRPGYVDPPEHHRARSLGRTIVESVIGPPLRLLMPSQVSPTGVLSKVLVDLASGDGDALRVEKGSGIEAGGRTVRSSAIRRLAGEL